MLNLLFNIGLILLVFSPLIFSKKSKNKDQNIGLQGVFRSLWFGIPFIHLLFLGNYIFVDQRWLVRIILAVTIAFAISVIVNWRNVGGRGV